MGLFEEQPLLLVPLIIVVVVLYDGMKWAVRRTMRTQQRRDRRRPIE